MKKIILNLLALSTFFIWSCNNNTTTNQIDNNTDNIKTNQSNAENIDLLNATFNGNEPFWDVKFEEDFAIFKSASEPIEGVKIYYKKNVGDNNNIKLTESIIKISDKEFKILGFMDKSSVEITIKNEDCDDGMSPEKYNRKITIQLSNNYKYEGCGKSK